MTPTEAVKAALRNAASHYLADGIDVHTLVGNALNRVADELQTVADAHPELTFRRGNRD